MTFPSLRRFATVYVCLYMFYVSRNHSRKIIVEMKQKKNTESKNLKKGSFPGNMKGTHQNDSERMASVANIFSQ